MRPRRSASRKPRRDGRKDFPSGPSRLEMDSRGETGVPSVRTMWQPTPRDGCARATATASLKAGPVAISVAEVRTPAEASSAMARLMPAVRPKSSALRMRRAVMAENESIGVRKSRADLCQLACRRLSGGEVNVKVVAGLFGRSEEHTSELQ